MNSGKSPSGALGNAAGPWVLVVLLALAVRLPLLAGYDPVSFPDTGTYLQAARDLVSGDFSVGQGRRTPGYPLIVAAFGGHGTSIVAFQLLSGIVTSLLLFWIAATLTGNRWWGAAAGAAHALNLQQLFTEGALLTEALSALTVIASLALLLSVCSRLRRGQNATVGLLAVGVLCTYALFVRPQFICLLVVAPAAAIWAVSAGKWPSMRSLVPAIMILLPAMALLAGWGMVQKAKTGYFTLSTQSGFGLVNHTVAFIETAPDEYAQVRDILQRTRDRRIAELGHSRNTIWYAWPEIQRTTGWSLPEASLHLKAMSQQVVAANPGRYALSVASAWVDFWTVPFFWEPEQVHPPALRHAVEGVWWVQHKLLRLANLAFVLVVAGVCVWPALRRRLRWDIGLSAIAATVLMSSLIQALADQGASSRYHLPTQSLVVLVLLIVAARWRQSRPGVAAAAEPKRT